MAAAPGTLVVRSLALAATLLAAAPAVAAVKRAVPPVAAIVTVKGDEQVSFIDEPPWRVAEIEQDLAQGDTLRTGRYGALSILFRDSTQIRVHRNTTLLVRTVRDRAGGGETLLRLDAGSVWSRARARQPDKLRMETPAATAAIRGTDWHLRVEPSGQSTLIVLEGVVDFYNDQGRVTVTRGEIAVAEVGRAPVKSILLNPRDRPQWELVLTPDWVRFVPVSGLTPGRLAPERRRLEALAAADATRRLDLAELAYEMGDYAAAAQALAAATVGGTPADRGRIRLMEALLAAQQFRFEAALDAFTEAAPALAGRRQMIARVGRYLMLAAMRRYPEAEAALADALQAHPGAPEPHLARIHLLSLQSVAEAARQAARDAAQRFPDDSRFPVWLAHFALIDDEPAEMRAALDRALRLDPDDYLAWHLLGTFHHFVQPDSRRAIEAYRRALAVIPSYAPAWNNLALVYAELGDYATAREHIETALRLAPRDPLYKATLGAFLAALFERLDEAGDRAREALALEPAHAGAMMVLGGIALRRGETDDAVDWLLRATVANPGLARATTDLAVAQYQAGDFEEARRSIDTALRLDEHDAVPALVASAYAQDQAEAGRAIRLAREALVRFERHPTLAIESLAHPQSGVLSLGSAYANLGLTDWGEYLGHLAFTPYSAADHFFLATVYGDADARRSSNVQGLLLDPLAVSARARYLDLVRRPFHDLSVGATFGAEGGALVHSQFATLQGLIRQSPALAYNLSLRREAADGPRDNDRRLSEQAVAALGVRADHENDVVLTLGVSRTRAGLPGPEDHPDPDDRTRELAVGMAVGYHHRFGPANHLLARATATFAESRFTNGRPFGAGLSTLSYSLIDAFGLAGAQSVYAAGVCDASGVFFPPGPNFGVGATCFLFGLPFLRSDIPGDLDFKTVRDSETRGGLFQLQLRHLVGLGPVHVSYGVQGAAARLAVETDSLVPGFPRTGLLIPLFPAPTLPFPFRAPTVQTTRSDVDHLAVQGHAQGTWKVTPTLTAEGGLALSHFDGPFRESTTQLDPKGGIAWRAAPGHWLRLTGERALVLPIDGSLAPVATLGMVAPRDFTAPGSSVTSYRARWDAGWGERVYTFVEAERRRLDRYALAVPQSLERLAVEKGELWGVSAGANAWILEQWGAFARHRWTWTDNLSRDGNRHRDLPLVPGRALDLGLTWVHPWQIRATVVASYLGRRAADAANAEHLDGAWTLGAAVNWQPWRKRWSFTLAGQDLSDARPEAARGHPSSGRTVTFSAEFRFGAQ